MASASWVGTPSIRGKSGAARMALLTVCLAGVQVTLDCTPYLLSLGVSKSKTSLVWIAGPLSGLITQPIVGALADRSRLKWGRRRPFMIAGTGMVALSLLMLGWTSEVVGLFVGGDEDKHKSATIVVAVLSIYVLDFAVNADRLVQASCRAIIVDTLSIRRQQQGSAWASRMIAAGNVISYLAGSIDLVGIFGHWFLGNTQFKKLCLISSVILGGTVSLTSWAVSERVLLSRRESDTKEGVFHIFVVIYQTLFNLPNRIRAICFIQFFAWLGWFPFLFFSSTWVGEVFQRYDQPKLPKSDDGDGGRPKDAVADIARVGSMALVLFACISLIGSITLPWIVQSPPSDTAHRRRPPQIAVVTRVLEFIKPFKPTLSTAWMVSHVIFAIAMSLAVFATSLRFATVLVVICGIPWAITCWAPFAMLGEEINRISQGSSGDHLMNDSGEVYNRLQQLADHEGDDDDEERQRLTKDDGSSSSENSDNEEAPEEADLASSRTRTPRRSDLESANLAPPPRSPREVSGGSDGSMSPTLHVVQTPELQTEEAQNASTGELAGIYLGILNLFITLPQFVGSFMSFIVFAILEPGKSPELAEGGGDSGGEETPQKGVNAIAVTMLIGGLGSIVAAWRTFKLPRVR
ncbi:General alpha-glucoside permease [Drechslerella dactyloides]|uniref:General alpha-glucoside permease n=1 Tax=Drechslerella dactyloides TaxID=74499 RepID=A0AAD6ISH5_DREDA|nr:General alpha-glucoside permease [Drechslerella dactyloides]